MKCSILKCAGKRMVTSFQEILVQSVICFTDGKGRNDRGEGTRKNARGQDLNLALGSSADLNFTRLSDHVPFPRTSFCSLVQCKTFSGMYTALHVGLFVSMIFRTYIYGSLGTDTSQEIEGICSQKDRVKSAQYLLLDFARNALENACRCDRRSGRLDPNRGG